MKRNIILPLLLLVSTGITAEWHVAISGNNSNLGSAVAPFRSIQKAADLAQPGDTVTVHQGIYRERVNPPRGGESDARRIIYQTAPSEKVEILGSEVAKGWVKVGHEWGQNTWKLTLPNSYFGSFNPYADQLGGEWYIGRGFAQHSATVYVRGEWTEEARELKEVLALVGEKRLWKAEVDATNTTIWAQMPGLDPNAGEVEISVRQCIFYPDKPGRNYITVRGFIMRNAATPWAGAMSEQIGLIGTHWSKGWIIEENTISHSMCSGITLGRYALPVSTKLPPTAPGFVSSIEFALRDGWNREQIGGHVIRNNHISHCEKNAIHGSLGGIFSTITGNRIHDIAVRRWVYGEDTAAIKLLGSQGVLIAGNRIYGNALGLWLDWMAQGTRVSRNLFYDNSQELFLEANHGPCLLDNNLFLSATKVENRSEGNAFVHNLFTGTFIAWLDHRRATPWFKPHSTEIAGLAKVETGDDRFFNNIFVGQNQPTIPTEVMCGWMEKNKRMVGWGIGMYDFWPTPPATKGNLYYSGATPYSKEVDGIVSSFDPSIRVEDKGDEVYLHIELDSTLVRQDEAITTQKLGRTRVSQANFEAPDGKPMDLSQDYFGKERDRVDASLGPFEKPSLGGIRMKIWGTGL